MDNLSNFIFLEKEFPILFNVGQAAEFNLHHDPITSLFKLRQFGEKLTEKLFEEHFIEFPYDNTFHKRLKTLEFENILPYRVKDLLFTIKNKGNLAVHDSKGSIDDAKAVLFSTFKVSKWFYETYSSEAVDISEIKFSMPKDLDARHALSLLENDYNKLEKKFEKLLEEREIKEQTNKEKQVVLQRSEKAANKIDMSEAETRELIDEQLRQAGWEVETSLLNYKLHKTTPKRGKNMAIAEWPVGNKWADYALFIGTYFYGIVEAKKYVYDISTDLRQSKIYARLASEIHHAKLRGEWNDFKVPFLFSTNGRPYLEQIKTKSGIWFIDIRKNNNQSKSLRGWYSPEGLEKLFKQDHSKADKKLKETEKDYLTSSAGLSLRDYQIKAIEAVENTIINHPDKKRALLAMATGTGKTRTIMGLCHRLIKSNRFRRILFLVDRNILGTQALNAFADNNIMGINTFADVYDVKGLKDIVPDIDTRLQFATVQGMVKRLFYSENYKNIPSIDTYDCIIVDEAHRGYLMDREIDEGDLSFKDQKDYVSKYRMVLDYFDAFAVGLTATPALQTSEVFGLPIYSYSYREAVIDDYLTDHDPPYQIKTKLSEEGIKWEKGEKPKAYDRETNSIVELAELEDELEIDVSGFNKLVLTESFNHTVISYLVNEIDPEEEAKTLVFAASDEHADEVVRIFKEEYEKIGVELPDEAIQKITGKSYNPQEQVLLYKNEKWPNIAVTVDLLSTGIDVPEISNIVFLRRIKSRILYEQMMGRATRKCDEIGKEIFKIYDAVRLYEALEDYTQMKPVVPNPKTTFTQLANELHHIDSTERTRKQLDQIIAKFQRKKKYLTNDQEAQFKYLSKDKDPESFINLLKEVEKPETITELMQMKSLWKFLDELKPPPATQLLSEHQDEYLGTDRGYGKGQKPEDYINSFKQFIKENENKISALKIICTRPKELDRKTLKELKIILDQQGFTARTLNTAWKDTKNVDIAADIISYIRTLAVGNTLISHEERIKNAVDKVRKMDDWNAVQKKWIDRFEKQLLKETILKAEDLNLSPFADSGGYKRLNKVFGNRLDIVIDTINDNLYIQTA